MDVRCKQLIASALVFGCLSSAHAGSSNGLPVRDNAGNCVEQGVQASTLQPGCDAMNRVILLPDASGEVGAVVVMSEGGSKTLNTAYGAAY